MDILKAPAYNLNDCLGMCASYDVLSGGGGGQTPCVSAQSYAEMNYTTNDNCVLKKRLAPASNATMYGNPNGFAGQDMAAVRLIDADTTDAAATT